jgi:hypothetical protein
MCAEIASAEISEVSRKVDTGGGISCAMRAIASSAIVRGLGGLCATKPTASAPDWIASWASADEEMQHIFTRVLIGAHFAPTHAEGKGSPKGA